MSTGENVTNEKCVSFLTGSYAYGTPNSESDVDLVVNISEHEISVLKQLADSYIHNDSKYGNGNDSMMFGKLNLICISDRKRFEEWREVTTDLQNTDKSYTKEESSKIFHQRLDIE